MKGYRAEIDGLRSIAIVPVVLFHAGFKTFSGGFVGVDVFFVISGFLITGLIQEEIRQGRFSIVTFYERRIRRLFPALFAVLAFSSIAALCLLLPDDLKAFGKSLVAAVLFGSNILFWREAGYFGSEDKPLLHTWSLAVEEQFYIVFPLVLLLLWRLQLRTVFWVALLGVGSFVLSILAVHLSPKSAFYLLPARAWELMLGAVAALGAFAPVQQRALREVLGWLGLLLIGVAIFMFSPESQFPGWRALLPCVGTVLIIVSTSDGDSSIKRLLKMAPLVWIGLISYSLYLWHWPLIVFSEYYLLRPFETREAALAIAVSVLAAYLSWKFIEAPFRRKDGVFTRPVLFPAAGAAMAVLAVFGMATVMANGLPQRLPADMAAMPWVKESGTLINDDRVPCSQMPHATDGRLALDRTCRVGLAEGATPDFVVWGDSHGEVMRTAIGMAAQKAGASGYFVGKNGCMPSLGVEVYVSGKGRDCQDTAREIVDAVLAHPEITRVFIVARWALYFEGTRYGVERGAEYHLDPSNMRSNAQVSELGLQSTLDTLRKAGRHVYLVRDTPEVGYNVPKAMGMKLWHGRELDIRPSVADFQKRNKGVWEMLERMQVPGAVDLLNPWQVLCSGATNCMIERDGIPLYSDDAHMSRFGAQMVSPVFDPVFQR